VKKDNAGFREKLRLRREALQSAAPGLVLETHAGAGRLAAKLYVGRPRVAIERDRAKAASLAKHHPELPVYESAAERALAGGLCADRELAVADVDPWGSPWPVLEALFSSPRAFADPLVLVVNDGLRRSLKLGVWWRNASLRAAVEHFGSDLYPIYLEVARWNLDRLVAGQGLRLDTFRGFYGGHGGQMSHYYAVIRA
jgi:hypothetical protein